MKRETTERLTVILEELQRPTAQMKRQQQPYTLRGTSTEWATPNILVLGWPGQSPDLNLIEKIDFQRWSPTNQPDRALVVLPKKGEKKLPCVYKAGEERF